MTRSFTCIICPNGCEITAEYEGDTVYAVQGATCPKGDAYVRQELTDPQRNIATSVLVEGGELPLASVRLSRPIPKKDIFRVMEVIRTVRLQAPTAVGQVALADVCGLGADVIVTKTWPARRRESRFYSSYPPQSVLLFKEEMYYENRTDRSWHYGQAYGEEPAQGGL